MRGHAAKRDPASHGDPWLPPPLVTRRTHHRHSRHRSASPHLPPRTEFLPRHPPPPPGPRPPRAGGHGRPPRDGSRRAAPPPPLRRGAPQAPRTTARPNRRLNIAVPPPCYSGEGGVAVKVLTTWRSMCRCGPTRRARAMPGVAPPRRRTRPSRGHPSYSRKLCSQSAASRISAFRDFISGLMQPCTPSDSD